MAVLSHSIIAATAVLKLKFSKLSLIRTKHGFQARSISNASPVGSPSVACKRSLRKGASPSWSTNRRQSRSKKRRAPGTSRGFHGLESDRGPMNISYRRKVSTPYSSQTTSGLTTFLRDLLILATTCSRGVPSAVRVALFPSKETSSEGIKRPVGSL